MEKENRKKFIHKPIYILILLVLLGLFMLGVARAQYVTNEKETDSYVAKNFYFESDLLSESTSSYTYGKGKNTIEFTLCNYADALRISEVDIHYTVTLTDSNGSAIATKNGTFTSGTKHTEPIRFENLRTGTYTVTAESTSPYTKTVCGTFYITEKEETLDFQISDIANSSILYLTMNTKDYAGEVLITYPEGVEIDNTDENIQSYTDTTMTVKVEANAEYAWVFFKENIATTYGKDDFTVSKK